MPFKHLVYKHQVTGEGGNSLSMYQPKFLHVIQLIRRRESIGVKDCLLRKRKTEFNLRN